MNHWVFLVVRPFCHVVIIAVLRETGGIHLPEVRVFCKIRSGLTDVIPTAPDKLSKTVIPVSVGTHNHIGIFGTPVGGAVTEGGALTVVIGEKTIGQREMVNASALQCGRSFAAENAPVRVFFVMLIIEMLHIIVANEIHFCSTGLGTFASHNIGTHADDSIAVVIQLFYGIAKHTGNFQSPVKVDIVNLIADAPDEHRGVIAVLPYPASEILFPPFLEIVAIIIIGFTFFPHIKTFCIEKKSHLITEFHQLHAGHIVGTADGVDTHILHGFQLPAKGFPVHGSTQCSQCMVLAGTIDFYIPPIQEKSFLAVEPDGAESEFLIVSIGYLTILE